MPDHSWSLEARWLEEHYGGLSDYRGSDLRGSWIAVIEQSIVDRDEDPVVLAMRVTAEHGEGRALFATVVRGRLG